MRVYRFVVSLIVALCSLIPALAQADDDLDLAFHVARLVEQRR